MGGDGLGILVTQMNPCHNGFKIIEQRIGGKLDRLAVIGDSHEVSTPGGKDEGDRP